MASALPNRPGSLNEHMARLRMKIFEQKMDKAKSDQPGTYDETAGNERLDPNKVRYHQSLLKRQELIERLKAASKPDTPQNRMINPYEDTRTSRPQSLPELTRNPSRGLVASPLVEMNHPVRGRRNSLDELMYNDPPHAAQPRYHQQPVQAQPVPIPVLQPQYQQPLIYQQPAALGGPLLLPVQTQGNKSEYYDMMMLQNAQMHQLFMQQMLAQGLKQPKQDPQTIVIEHPVQPQPQPQLQPQPQFITLPKTKKQRTKHYHHHYSQLPPIRNDERPILINHIRHAEPRQSTPVKTIRPSTKRKSPDYDTVRPPRLRPAPISIPPAPKKRLKHPFPGSKALRKLRHIFYAAWFVSFLKIAARKRKEGKSVDQRFIFGVQLKEAVGALHRIYLNPDGNIYPLLRDTISPGADDLTKAFNANNQKELQELVHILENIIYHMTDIMPKTGVLGTHKKAVIFDMLQPGNVFPDGYFWQVESNLMSFDEEGRTTVISDPQAKLLLIGLFLSRGVITTLMMKPLDYGVSSTLLDEIAEQNLKLVSSILLYIVRKVSVAVNGKIMGIPFEIVKYLYTDEELKPLLNKIQQTLDYADELLRGWIKEYTKRLRAAGVPR